MIHITVQEFQEMWFRNKSNEAVRLYAILQPLTKTQTQQMIEIIEEMCSEYFNDGVMSTNIV